MWPYIYAVVVLVVVYLFIRDPRTDKRAPFPYFNWPVVGNLPQIYQARSYALDKHVELVRKYGSFYLNIPPFVGVELAISDPPSIQFVLNDPEMFVLPALRKNVIGEVFGDGIFISNGENWKLQRSIAKPIFTLESRTDMYKVYYRSAELLANKFFEAEKEGVSVDIQTLFKQFTLDTFGEIGFGTKHVTVAVELTTELGYRIDSLVKPIPFSNAFEFILTEIDEIFHNPVRKYTNRSEFRRQIGILEDLVFKIIRDRKQAKDFQNKKDLLSRLLSMEANEEVENMTDKFLRDQIINFFIAGRDTTAVLLTWFTYFVAKHPEVEKKIREEIKRHVGDEKPNIRNTKELKYLQMCLDEALRLYPPAVPFNSKTCTSDCVLPNGLNVEKGGAVIYSPYAVHRLKEYWGDDCEEFRPERWEEPNLIKHPFQFLPFQKGPRICLGMNMAYEEAKCCIVMLYQKGIHFELDPKHKVQYIPTAILQAKDGVYCFIKREDSSRD